MDGPVRCCFRLRSRRGGTSLGRLWIIRTQCVGPIKRTTRGRRRGLSRSSDEVETAAPGDGDSGRGESEAVSGLLLSREPVAAYPETSMATVPPLAGRWSRGRVHWSGIRCRGGSVRCSCRTFRARRLRGVIVGNGAIPCPNEGHRWRLGDSKPKSSNCSQRTPTLTRNRG